MVDEKFDDLYLKLRLNKNAAEELRTETKRFQRWWPKESDSSHNQMAEEYLENGTQWNKDKAAIRPGKRLWQSDDNALENSRYIYPEDRDQILYGLTKVFAKLQEGQDAYEQRKKNRKQKTDMEADYRGPRGDRSDLPNLDEATSRSIPCSFSRRQSGRLKENPSTGTAVVTTGSVFEVPTVNPQGHQIEMSDNNANCQQMPEAPIAKTVQRSKAHVLSDGSLNQAKQKPIKRRRLTDEPWARLQDNHNPTISSLLGRRSESQYPQSEEIYATAQRAQSAPDLDQPLNQEELGNDSSFATNKKPSPWSKGGATTTPSPMKAENAVKTPQGGYKGHTDDSAKDNTSNYQNVFWILKSAHPIKKWTWVKANLESENLNSIFATVQTLAETPDCRSVNVEVKVAKQSFSFPLFKDETSHFEKMKRSMMMKLGDTQQVEQEDGHAAEILISPA